MDNFVFYIGFSRNDVLFALYNNAASHKKTSLLKNKDYLDKLFNKLNNTNRSLKIDTLWGVELNIDLSNDGYFDASKYNKIYGEGEAQKVIGMLYKQFVFTVESVYGVGASEVLINNISQAKNIELEANQSNFRRKNIPHIPGVFGCNQIMPKL